MLCTPSQTEEGRNFPETATSVQSGQERGEVYSPWCVAAGTEHRVQVVCGGEEGRAGVCDHIGPAQMSPSPPQDRERASVGFK